MTTLLLALLFAQNAFARDVPSCAEDALASAREHVTEAREQFRDAHKAYYGVDWKARAAMADDPAAVTVERKEAWARLRALRDQVAGARVAYREVRGQAANGTLACDATPSAPVS